MGNQRLQPSFSGVSQTPSFAGVWELAERQHGVVTRAQLLELGFHPQAIKHRLAKGRLHRVWRGVYAVGRPQLARYGRWMAAVLSCGPEAVLSHGSAAALWEIGGERLGRIEVSVPLSVFRRRPGIVVHRRAASTGRDVPVERETTTHHGIPVATPLRTVIDRAVHLPRGPLEAVINEADKRDLTNPEALRASLDAFAGRPGVAPLREALDRRTFVFTASELERRFLPIARRAGLSLPETGRRLNGFKVDFYLAEPGARRRDRRPALPPHPYPAGQGSPTRPDARSRGADSSALQSCPGQVRARPRAGDPGLGCPPAASHRNRPLSRPDATENRRQHLVAHGLPNAAIDARGASRRARPGARLP